MTRLKEQFVAALLICGVFSALADQPPDDIVFKALDDELKRSMSLHLEDLEAPYFIQYGVDDTVTFRISAAYGALSNSDRSHTRVLQSQVRVGSYQLDNSNFADPRGGGRSGLGGATELPTDDDYMALRHAIWRLTDWQYKEALETLTQKRAYMKDRNVEDRPGDFAKTEPIKAVKERVNLPFDRATWETVIRRISARFREFPHLQNADVNLVAGVENRYMLNSEGSRLRYGYTEALLRITAEAQADDGERLSDTLSYYAAIPEQLPKVEDVLADVNKLADRLAAAMRAPVLEDYTGPVLFDGLASAQLFRQLLARGIVAQADPVGVSRRGGTATEDLENRLGKRILPPTFQMYDDPRNAKFQDFFLAGHYLTDDEGIPAQRVNIVVDGKLEGMVMSRTPTKQFAKSNGHGRRGGGETPRAAVGCLYVESTKSETPENLKKQLLDAAESEGLKFGLRITGIQSRGGGPGRFAGGGGRFGRGGGRGGSTRVVGDPISIYKVYVADGHEEPVRGCEFNGLDVQSLRRILAAGNAPVVQNNVIGTTPSSSIIAPSVLIGEVELSRIKQEAEKKPILEAPHARR
ncbi:MAG: metallopeptidase TldD-related protein [Verrucomicrobiales bacterium]|nr:metallopeptidase TldD-related protein [Verrucomicrobiales bacterium]